MKEVYCVVSEHKMEGPLINESRLLNYDDALERARKLSADNRIIRVAIGRVFFEYGNEELLPKQEKDV